MIEIELKDEKMMFETGETLFSPRGLDRGTNLMLSHVDFEKDMKILDLGCGWGFVGILAGKISGAENVTMSDADPDAVRTAKKNAILNDMPDIKVIVSDGFINIDDTGYDLILSNPPYHSDFNVPKHFIEKGFNRLKIGGRIFMVTKRLKWYKKKLETIFGGVKVWTEGGYHVFMAEKRSYKYADKKR